MTPGMNTSEFKATVVACLTAVLAALNNTVSYQQALGTVAVLVISYIASRTFVKTFKKE